MNTTTHPDRAETAEVVGTAVTAAVAARTSRSLGRRAARIVGALAILFAGLFATLGTQAPAQAAVSYNTGISFCAKWYTGAAYANYPVRLQVYYNGGWHHYRNGQTASNGCGTFRNVDSGWSYRVNVYWTSNTRCPSTAFHGTSNWTTSYYNSIRSVGTFWVNATRLC